MNTTITEPVASLKEKPTTTQRVASKAHDTIDGAANRAEVMEQQLRDKAAKASDKLEASKDAASEKLESSLAKMEAFARERPMTAAGIAFAAGILASNILRR